MVDDSTKRDTSACPIEQMSFGEIARFLQNGFRDPIQKAVASHVQYCNNCQEALDKFKTLRAAGKHIVTTHVVEEPPDDQPRSTKVHLPEALLSAFVESRLAVEDHRKVKKHLSNCHACYLQYSALVKEMQTAVEVQYSTPMRVKNVVKKAARQRGIPLNGVLDGVTNSMQGGFRTVFDLKWPVPAMAFALGVIAMLLVRPAPVSVVALPGMPTTSLVDDHLRMSGSDMGDEPVEAIITLPATLRGDVQLTWPASVGKDVVYRINIFDSEGRQVGEARSSKKNMYALDIKTLDAGARYTILVTAVDENGVRPVVTQTLVRQY